MPLNKQNIDDVIAQLQTLLDDATAKVSAKSASIDADRKALTALETKRHTINALLTSMKEAQKLIFGA